MASVICMHFSQLVDHCVMHLITSLNILVMPIVMGDICGEVANHQCGKHLKIC